MASNPLQQASVFPTRIAEEVLEDLAAALDIPDSRYQAAERSYKSLGAWLERPDSLFHDVEIIVYPQGSFALGTVIRPTDDDEDYDLDMVCEIDVSRLSVSQAELQERFGREVRAYAKAHGMAPPDEWDRCWTLNYVDEAQFHIDTLPSVPDGVGRQLLLESTGRRNEWKKHSVAITDKKHVNFRLRTRDWPVSNPKGYAEWFRSRTAEIFEAKRRRLALVEAKANIEEIPAYRVKTPLQAAIQILKRHRDLRFDAEGEKPSSIVLTTLSARAYEGEATIAGALYRILMRMDRYILDRNGQPYIPNPTNEAENFADSWREKPERHQEFLQWLEDARADFSAAAKGTDRRELVESLAPRLGRKTMEAAALRRGAPSKSQLAVLADPATSYSLQRVLKAPHRQSPPWLQSACGTARIASATSTRRGGQSVRFHSDSAPLPKHCDLAFQATTDVPAPYSVYWQVVNTGQEAGRIGQLRGNFEAGSGLLRRESTLYTGTHAIECFIVKDGYLAARSGPFIVNIR